MKKTFSSALIAFLGLLVTLYVILSDRTGDDRAFESSLQDPRVSEPIRRSLPATLDMPTRRAVIESAAQILRESYVFPEVGEEAAQTIETALAEGRYSNPELQWAFAEQLTTDLQAVTNDQHLRVSAPGVPIGLPSGAPRQDQGLVYRELTFLSTISAIWK